MEAISEFVLDAVGSPWLYPVVFALTVADAFLVIVPSETVVVALGALALSTGQPSVFVLVPVAAVAAMVGDSMTYWLGRRITVTRFSWMRRPSVARTIAWAARALDQRAAIVLLTARFIPFGRIAVNLTAGATGFRYPRFLLLTVIAGIGWALYNSLVGALFGRLLGSDPLLAVGVSIAVAIGLGALVDAISARFSAKRTGVALAHDNPQRNPIMSTFDTAGEPVAEGLDTEAVTSQATGAENATNGAVVGETVTVGTEPATSPDVEPSDGEPDTDGENDREADTVEGALSPGSTATGGSTSGS